MNENDNLKKNNYSISSFYIMVGSNSSLFFFLYLLPKALSGV